MTDAVAALLSGLTTQQSARLFEAVQKITANAVQRFGIAPTTVEVIATAQAKEAAYSEGGAFDLENALHQLSTDAPSVVAHMAASAAGGGEIAPVGGYAETGVVTQDDIDAMAPILRSHVRVGTTSADIESLSPSLRMSLTRSLVVPDNLRGATTLKPAAEGATTGGSAKEAQARLNAARKVGTHT